MWLAAPPWSDGGARSRWRGFRVAIFVQKFLEAFRRGSTLLGAPRTILELKEVRGGGGVIGAATNVVKRGGLRGSFEAVRRRTRPNQELVRVARFRDGSWVPRRTQGWPEKNGFDERKRKRGFREVRERGDREERESPKKFKSFSLSRFLSKSQNYSIDNIPV